MPSAYNTILSRPDKMQIILTSTILLSLLHPIGTSIYLLDTHDGPNIEHYDCLHIDSLPYCRRPRLPINLNRNDGHFSCNQTNGGILHRFSDLRANNVSISTILHRWRSSIEQVEAYARYLREKTVPDGHLCECQHGTGFGKSCEYQLPIGATVKRRLDWQVNMRKTNEWKVQVYGNITSYEGIRCDSGRLCLDWRQICDGTQNCMFGSDEQNCDILEMNTCDDDEYRCSNGMCIPDQYFLDGEPDCLDWTDEMEPRFVAECAWERASVGCDDRICLRNRWSCGDGQCIWYPLFFQTDKYIQACLSRRDQYFMCETHFTTRMWTMPNGRCNGDENHVATPLIEPTDEEQCEYLLKCTLSRGWQKNCPCQRHGYECWKELQKRCPNKTIQYPKGAFMAPFLFFFFDTSQQSTASLPHYIVINGTVKCRHTFVHVMTEINYFPYLPINQIIDFGMCNEKNSLDLLKWNESVDQCFRANESSDVCRGWNPCLSVTRLQDGWWDCWNGGEENRQMNEDIGKSCARVHRHRFRCSLGQPTCLGVAVLADGRDHCANGYDEVWPGTNRRLYGLKCSEKAKDGCSLLRQYIEQSPPSLQNNETQTMVRMPFRSYCDTIRDLESGEDEDRVDCQRWWKCTRTQHWCGTGQCIDRGWVNDDEWDCTDASDEGKRFQNNTRWMRGQVSIQQSGSEVTWDWDTCHSTSSFVCLSAHSRRRQFICLNQSQLGDNTIDCLGAIDERNTLPGCSESSAAVLGYHFLCPSTNHCVPFWKHCQEEERCQNRIDDDHWCSRSAAPTTAASNCTGRTDFICFNGRCILGSRCNNEFDCPFGEDEHMCDYLSTRNAFYLPYRLEKGYDAQSTTQSIEVPVFPDQLNTAQLDVNEITIPSPPPSLTESYSSSLTPYWCNRGLGILAANNHSIVCFCPPHYYGDFCEYHADRLLLLLHLNLSQSIYTSRTDPSIVIKLLVLFLFDDQVLMTHEFHVRPASEITTVRQEDDSSALFAITHLSPASTKIGSTIDPTSFTPIPLLFASKPMKWIRQDRLALMAVWHYPIIFDHLPVFRLAKVLHWTKMDRSARKILVPLVDVLRMPECHSLMNDHSQAICLCNAGFIGENCTIRDEQCATGYCAPSSLCMPSYRSLLRGQCYTLLHLSIQSVWCDRCEIIHDYCQPTSCLRGGTCHPTSQPDRVFCVCPNEYRGSNCETMKPHVRLSLIDRIQYAGAVVQYFQIDLASITSSSCSSTSLTERSCQDRSSIIMMAVRHPPSSSPKTYDSYDGSVTPHFYLLSVVLDVGVINGTTEMSNAEQNVNPYITLSNGNLSHLDSRHLALCSVLVSSPIQYHHSLY